MEAVENNFEEHTGTTYAHTPQYTYTHTTHIAHTYNTHYTHTHTKGTMLY